MVLADIGSGDLLWSLIVIFFMVMYFMVFFMIIVDLFRDHEMSGIAKALWIFALIFFSLIAMLIYLIVRGPKMSQRAAKDAAEQQKQFNAYVKDVAGSTGSPADQIAKANELLKQGVITQADFDAIKAKALSGAS